MPCDAIDQDREDTMVYHVPGRAEGSKIIEFNFFSHKQRGPRSYTVNFVEKACPRLYALSSESTVMDVKRLVLERMRGIFE